MKRVFSFLLCVVLVFGMVPAVNMHVDATTTTANEQTTILCSGALSTTVSWTLDKNGVLTISGTGAIPDQDGSPWYSYRNSIKHIVIEEGITYIGKNAFNDLRNYQTVVIPQGVTAIGKYAFQFGQGMHTIYIPKSLNYVAYCAFNYCWSLSTVYYEGTPSQFYSIQSDYGGLGNEYFFEAGNMYFNYIYPISDYDISSSLGNISMGPWALKGAFINIFGHEIPLIDIEAKIGMNIGSNFKVVATDDSSVKVLLGFDQNASANIQQSTESPTYWSDSYQEVKTMYQNLTGKKVDTTRLWNKFSAMRGKLKTENANMVVGVTSTLTGYAEFKLVDGEFTFSDGGVIVALNANTSLRSYYGPCYVALGIGANIDGELIFENENNKINPHITVSPAFTVSAGGGIGTRSTYAQIDAYGTLSANISTKSESPFEAGVELGIRWMGYIFGKEIFSDSQTLASMELYPNLGKPWKKKNFLTQGIDFSDVDDYNAILNAANPIERDYLTKHSTVKKSPSTNNSIFIKENAYPLSAPRLIPFNNDTMLLVWIDDLGEKTHENMGSILYSYFNGMDWSEPAVIYEDGTTNDMPSVYSDGRFAYIVWQKANQQFESNTDTTEMMKHFDLYAAIFDCEDQTFGEPICVNDGDDTVFEFNPLILGKEGSFTVAWIENSDNNIYQMSGTNSLKTCDIDMSGNVSNTDCILLTTDMFTNIAINDSCIYYSVVESGCNKLYYYQDSAELLAENIQDFDYVGGLLFYSTTDGLYSFNGETAQFYNNIGALNEFQVDYNAGTYVLFTPVLNEDFSKNLYYSKLTDGIWSEFEIYSNSDKYIRDYVPVILNDGKTYVAFNYVTSNMQSATITVDRCTNDVDTVLHYVDFDDSQISSGQLALHLGIHNNSSTVLESFTVEITDQDGNTIYTQNIQGELTGFGDCELITDYLVPEGYNNEIYTVKVIPNNYTDWNTSNNLVKTTFECNHDKSAIWKLSTPPTESENGFLAQNCLKCGIILDTKELQYLQISDVSFSLDPTLSVKCRVKTDILNGYNNPQIAYKIDGEEYIETKYTVQDGYYVFSCNNIIPEQMGMPVYATLYATRDGTECASALTSITLPDAGILAWNITLADDISANFHICLTEEKLNKTAINITVGNNQYSVNANGLSKSENGCYILKVGIAAAQMTDIISLQLAEENGEFYTSTYTIREYAETILNDSTLSKEHNLVVAMLNYGAASQKYFTHNEDALANEGISSEVTHQVPKSTADMLVNGRINGINFYGASLVYQDRIAVRYYFTGDVTGCTFTANGNTYTPVEKDSMYYVEIADILPQNLDQQITLTVTDASGNTLTVAYGPMNYIVRMDAKGDENLKNLMKALYNYHLAAKNYENDSKQDDSDLLPPDIF